MALIAITLLSIDNRVRSVLHVVSRFTVGIYTVSKIKLRIYAIEYVLHY